ncbi:FGGY carbohydrate kinase domain-containing protein [Powellomyces hirtus]|nr:FGGY carbohydrate kinase domain-containing protein [Powellomyces hirtus]
MTQERKYYLGVDVGTTSARAAVVDSKGTIVATHVCPLEINKPRADYYEQSSDNIWNSCCTAVRKAIEESKVEPAKIKGLGFDATCSLVALDTSFFPVSVSPSGNAKWNVIMWMDHRAAGEAEEMSSTGHPVLQRTGGKISPEMSAAKLVWLARHMRESFDKATTLIELPDFLTLKATGSPKRSLNSLACKWTYTAQNGFDDAFWSAVGMDHMVRDAYRRCLGEEAVASVGELVGSGLTPAAASELGIDSCAGMNIGAAVIDAYAGAIGTLGGSLDKSSPKIDAVHNRMALICGTSSCHIAISRQEMFVSGIWGPYTDILLPGFHVHEGGQSITGALLTHIVTTHPAFAELDSQNPFGHLNTIVHDLAKQHPFPALITRDTHLTPDFHGNRSPLADPSVRGVHIGCDIDVTVNALAKLYYATVLALCYGTRQIIDALNAAGHKIDTLFLSGGLVQNALFVQSVADCTRCKVALPVERDAVLLGAAMLGAAAADAERKPAILWESMVEMGKVGKIIEPCKGIEADFHEKKYKAFQILYMVQDDIKNIMGN